MGEAEISTLVADSGAFIKGAPLQKWSRRVVTVKDVVSEIRDKATRERLQVLPYDLAFKEPSAEALHHVTQFSKKTGDYGSLSPVDLKLIALTYQLQCELEPTSASRLRNSPPKEQPVQEGASIPNMVGFYAPHQKNTHRGTGSLPTGGGERVPHTGQVDSSVGKDDLSSSREESESQDDAHRTERVECVRDEPKRSEACGELVCGEVEKQEEEEEEEEEEEGSDSDGEGWITPENFQQVCEEMGGVSEERPRSLAVGCMTTDFAMQNVLLQMGLNLISVEGMKIRQLRTYAKKCKGCFKTTTNTGLQFCPCCGNKTLYKVSVVVDAQGTFHYRPLSQKQFSHKGLRYPLPKPKGGRHAHNPILSPDQQTTYKERRRRENKVNPLDADYVALTSPFTVHDITSKGARVAMATSGAGRHHRRNPNAVKPKGRNK